MPSGIYPRTETHNKHNSEYRKKNIPKGAFKKGYILPKESIEKMRLSKKNVPWSEIRRKAQEARQGKPYKGKKGYRKPIHLRKPFIKNGKEYPQNWNEIRKEVYKKDNWICQGCSQNCGRAIGISCHHIDYNTKNNNLSNLITLCASCHAKTNFNRGDWVDYYTNTKGEK